ncbi:uncharacterized protein [Chanodichthys erythropterus]
MILDSEEEFTFSSEEDCNSDDEQLHFQQRIDPDEDIISENVAASRSPSPAPRRGARRSRSVLSAIENHTDNVAASQSPSPAPRRGARRSRSVLSAIENHTECDNENIQEPVPKRQSTLSWKTQTDVDMVPHTLRFLPARETGPQLNSAESHSPMNLFKLFFYMVTCPIKSSWSNLSQSSVVCHRKQHENGPAVTMYQFQELS